MQDETIPNQAGEQSTQSSQEAPAPVIKHLYYEVGSDVLSKPNALCDLLEVEGCPPTCVFCNSPSDADLVEVILKKRGISALKLIGHVPPMRSARTLKQVKSGEVACLVVTDVSGQTLDVEELDLVVNYALPTDPEVYIHRCGHSRPGAKLAKVVSLIGALDIANLHYLRKIVEFPIDKGELPSKEQLSSAKIGTLRKQAIEVAGVKDEHIKELTGLILADEHKEAIVSLLLRNTLEVLPSLQAGAQRGEGREEDFGGGGDREDRGYDDRGGRGDRGDRGDRRGGRGRGGRDYDRGNDRGGDERRGRDSDRGGNRYEDEGGGSGDSQDFDQPRNNRRFRDDDDRPRDDRRDDRPRRERTYVPPEKFARVYLGHGNEQGITKDKLNDILTQDCKVEAAKIKLSNVRNNYSFFDIPEESADAIIDSLNEVQHGHGKLFARRATTISVPRPQTEASADDQGGFEGQGSQGAVDTGEEGNREDEPVQDGM